MYGGAEGVATMHVQTNGFVTSVPKVRRPQALGGLDKVVWEDSFRLLDNRAIGRDTAAPDNKCHAPKGPAICDFGFASKGVTDCLVGAWRPEDCHAPASEASHIRDITNEVHPWGERFTHVT